MTEWQRDCKVRELESKIDLLSRKRSRSFDNIDFSMRGIAEVLNAYGHGITIGNLQEEIDRLKNMPVEPNPPSRYEIWRSMYGEGKIVRGKITTIVNQGFLVDIDEYEAFLPYSHADIDVRRVQGDKLIGLECEFEILESGNDHFVVSRKNVLLREIERQKKLDEQRQQESQKAKSDFFQHLVAGKVVDGTVVKLFDYGALVDIGGFCGLLPNVEISYKPVSQPSDLIVEGQRVRVVILSVDKAHCKAKLSMRKLEPRLKNDQTDGQRFKAQSAHGDKSPWRIRDREGLCCEFKTSIIYSPQTHKPGIDQVEQIAATVAAFMNSEGGILYLGVKDNGIVVGVEADFDVLGSVTIRFPDGSNDSKYDYMHHRNIDGFKNKLGVILKAYLGAVADSQCDRETKSCDGRTCVAVHVPRSSEPVYFGTEQDLYVRVDNCTRRLVTAKDVADYMKIRFAK